VDLTRLLDIGMGAVFGGGLTSTWLQLRDKRRTERNQRREQYAELFIDIRGILDTVFAIRAIAATSDDPEPEKAERWDRATTSLSRRIQGQLMLLAHKDPSRRTRRLANQMSSAIGFAMWAARMDPDRRPLTHPTEVFKEDWYKRTDRLLTRLRNSI
jgi:hypothetical protein